MSSGQKEQSTLDGWIKYSAPPAALNKTDGVAKTGNSSAGKGRRDDSEAIAQRRAQLAGIAAETRTVLPSILAKLPDIHASKSERIFLDTLPRLTTSECPRRTADYEAKIHVVNEDSFNVAIRIGGALPPGSARVAVLNMASHANPGGGWLSGALAQEEALCYRSSLALSLHRRYYPWKQHMGVYSPDVVIIRGDMPSGHKLLDPATVTNLPVVSVLGIAALRCPPTRRIRENTLAGPVEREVFAKDSDRVMTKDKMRLCLRMAARKGHTNLVLGALGCGAFKNPRREVAECWLEVLREQEFRGGWWDGIWFAVYDRKNEGNFEVFEELLDDVPV
jgi:uncharacterized protein (TIGR02452 family)